MASNNTDIRYLKGVGEKRAEILKSKGIDTIGTLLRFYPRDYIDYSDITPIYDCFFNMNVCIKARVTSYVSEDKKRPGMVLYSFTAEDSSGSMQVVLFNQKYLANKINFGSEYLFYGKLEGGYYMRTMKSPEIFEVGYSGIHPIYKASAKMSSKNIEKLTKTALSCSLGDDPIPQSVRDKNGLCDLAFALENIHFPRTKESLARAKRRLVFEELFILQTGLALLKNKKRTLSGSVIKRDFKAEFEGLLSFPLTSAQSRVIDECFADMASGRVMNRLIQGDVGSGKTAVAAAICYITAKNGYQSAFMAPTEILAEQHFATLSAFFEESGVKCGLLTGSLTAKQKREIKEDLSQGRIDIIVGTHALLTDNVEFNSLGLAVTDEQHRFGVAQRAKLAAKGKNPHTLVMSATPIPRTLALIIHGDLDISIIDEYPKGRQSIDTYCVDSSYRKRIYNFIKKHIAEGRQAYIVCPLVEENEELDIKSANEYFDELSKGEFKGYSLGLLHGKMSGKEKDAVMRRFKDDEIQLLIATTVIEVGIDVPNAVLMVIENADRFGLSQLHQLRGRIGRGKHKSSCILISDSKSEETAKRLNVIKASNDGFNIADEDLKLRGPGDFLGNRQHGLPDLKIADFASDMETLRLAGAEVRALLIDDRNLESKDNRPLREAIEELYQKLNG